MRILRRLAAARWRETHLAWEWPEEICVPDEFEIHVPVLNPTAILDGRGRLRSVMLVAPREGGRLDCYWARPSWLRMQRMRLRAWWAARRGRGLPRATATLRS